MLAAKTTVPVLGVPVPSRYLKGQDSLLSIVQMPKGIPVATFAIGEAGAANAALFAVSLIAHGSATPEDPPQTPHGARRERRSDSHVRAARSPPQPRTAPSPLTEKWPPMVAPSTRAQWGCTHACEWGH